MQALENTARRSWVKTYPLCLTARVPTCPLLVLLQSLPNTFPPDYPPMNAPACACNPTIIGKDACMNLPLHRNMLDKTLFFVGAGFCCHAGMRRALWPPAR